MSWDRLTRLLFWSLAAALIPAPQALGDTIDTQRSSITIHVRQGRRPGRGRARTLGECPDSQWLSGFRPRRAERPVHCSSAKTYGQA
jgi:hypothetical protein